MSIRVALIGWGAIATTVAKHLADVDTVDIVAVGVRGSGERAGLPAGAEEHVAERGRDAGECGGYEGGRWKESDWTRPGAPLRGREGAQEGAQEGARA